MSPISKPTQDITLALHEKFVLDNDATAPPRPRHKFTDEHVYLFTNFFSIDQHMLCKWTDSTYTSVIKDKVFAIQSGIVSAILKAKFPQGSRQCHILFAISTKFSDMPRRYQYWTTYQ